MAVDGKTFKRGDLMKRLFVLFLALFLSLSMLFAAPMERVDAEDIALGDAGVKRDDVRFIWSDLDRDDGRLVYDVEFFFDGTEYDYEIDAEDGRILSLDRDAERYDKRFFDDKDGFLSRDGALEIALLDAGLGRKDISREKIELERDDGFVSYEIEFRSNEGRSFEYVVGAADGRVYKAEWERRLLRQDRNAPSLSFGEAEKIALSVVPGADPSDLRIHEDRDDGRRTFEASILSDGMIYDFELDAVTGEIRSYSKEIW